MIILTGGAGFIGSVVLGELNRRGQTDIVVVDHLGTCDKWKNLRGKQFSRYIERTDFLAELNKHPENFEKATAILHLGACSSTTERDVDFLMHNNVDYSERLAEFSKENGIRFVYASSAATYGMGEQGYADTLLPRTLSPLNAYGFSKNVFDGFMTDTLKFDWGAVGIKFFNVYGPNEYHKKSMASLVGKAHEQIKKFGFLKLYKSNTPDYKDGGQQRDFVYVSDCASMVCDLLESKKKVTGLRNCGTGTPRSWNELANAVFDSLGKPVEIKYVDMPDEICSQYQNYTCANMKHTQNDGLMTSPTSLEAGIGDYVQNYLEKSYQRI